MPALTSTSSSSANNDVGNHSTADLMSSSTPIGTASITPVDSNNTHSNHGSGGHHVTINHSSGTATTANHGSSGVTASITPLNNGLLSPPGSVSSQHQHSSPFKSSSSSLLDNSHAITSSSSSSYISYNQPASSVAVSSTGSSNTGSSNAFDFKPHHLADWYAPSGLMGNMRAAYDPHAHAAHAHHYSYQTGGMGAMAMKGHNHYLNQPTHHVSAALPTPPSSGHSPIQGLAAHHLPLLTHGATSYT